MKFVTPIFYIFLVLFLTGCAQQVAPTGGPEDKQAPLVESDASTQNGQTNFQGGPIELYFSEWVKLQDAFNQVVISPPLEKRPKIYTKKKSVHIEFDKDEILRENATYTINFGDAIRDITANNILKNFTFAFSTGDFIDSLTVSGTVLDAFDSKPMKDITVMLYENLEDSVIYKEKPFYFAKTDANGKFNIGNIKEGKFKVVAIEDINRNFKFEAGSEKLGFLPEPVFIQADSSIVLNLQIAKAVEPFRMLSKNTKQKGLIILGFNAKPDGVEIQSEGAQNLRQEIVKDSIYLWYDSFLDSSIQIIARKDSILNDTFVVQKRKVSENYRPLSLIKGINTSNGELVKGKEIELLFNYPLAATDENSISIQDSSENEIPLESRIEGRKMILTSNWSEEMPYHLFVEAAGIRDVFGNESDSISLRFTSGQLKDFSVLRLQIDGFLEDNYYIVSLVKGSEIIFESVVKDSQTFERVISFLKPDSYQLKILEDTNRNGRWDPPNYQMKKPAERFTTSEINDLRANWDKDLKINWQEE